MLIVKAAKILCRSLKIQLQKLSKNVAVTTMPKNSARKPRIPLKAPCLMLVNWRRTIRKTYKCQMGKKKKTYVKLRHDSDIKVAKRCVQLSVAVVTYATNDPFDH